MNAAPGLLLLSLAAYGAASGIVGALEWIGRRLDEKTDELRRKNEACRRRAAARKRRFTVAFHDAVRLRAHHLNYPPGGYHPVKSRFLEVR